LLDQLASAPLVVPGIVLGVAVLLFYLYVPIPFYGTIWIIVVAFVAAYSPYGMRYLKPAFLSVSVELEEAARVSGARQPSVFRKVLLPLTSNAALGTGLYVFFGSFRELAIPAMVVTAATPVLATQLLDTLVNGNLNIVSALGTFIMAVSVLAAIGAFRLTTRLSK
jgi:iron(III) transport system permease protein